MQTPPQRTESRLTIAAHNAVPNSNAGKTTLAVVIAHTPHSNIAYILLAIYKPLLSKRQRRSKPHQAVKLSENLLPTNSHRFREKKCKRTREYTLAFAHQARLFLVSHAATQKRLCASTFTACPSARTQKLAASQNEATRQLSPKRKQSFSLFRLANYTFACPHNLYIHFLCDSHFVYGRQSRVLQY